MAWETYADPLNLFADNIVTDIFADSADQDLPVICLFKDKIQAACGTRFGWGAEDSEVEFRTDETLLAIGSQLPASGGWVKGRLKTAPP